MKNNRSGEVDTVQTPAAAMEPSVYPHGERPADCFASLEGQIHGIYASRIAELHAAGATGFTVTRMAGAFQAWATDVVRLSAIMPDDRLAVATRYLDAMNEVAPDFGKSWALASVTGSSLEDAMRQVLGAS